MSWRSQISRHVQEFRMVACCTSESSNGLRTFFRKNYEELKMLNPYVDFVYREAEQMKPFIYARYDWGKEKQVFVQDLTPEGVMQTMKELVEYGETLPKSPESDRLVHQPIIDGGKDEEMDYFAMNLTWDGKTIRRNPEMPVPEFDINAPDDEDDELEA